MTKYHITSDGDLLCKKRYSPFINRNPNFLKIKDAYLFIDSDKCCPNCRDKYFERVGVIQMLNKLQKIIKNGRK